MSIIVSGTWQFQPPLPPAQPGLPAWLKPGGQPLSLGQWVQVPNSSVVAAFPSSGVSPTCPDYQLLVTAGLAPRGQTQPAGSDYGNVATGTMNQGGGTKIGTKMILHGGGGAGAWAGNEARALDLNVDSPVWRILYAPTAAAQIGWGGSVNIAQNPPYDPTSNYYGSDGVHNAGGASMHSYFRVNTIEKTGPYAGYLIRIGYGQVWCSDNDFTIPVNQDFSGVNLSTGQWLPKNTLPLLPVQGLYNNPICKHPTTEVFYLPRGSLFTWDPANPTAPWATLIAPAGYFSLATNGNACIDPDQNLWFQFGPGSVAGDGSTWRAHVVDLSSPTPTMLEFALSDGGSGALATVQSQSFYQNGLVYDTLNKCFIFYQGTNYLWTIKRTGSLSQWDFQIIGSTIGPTISNWADSWPNSSQAGANAPTNDKTYGGQAIVGGRMQYIPELGGICIIGHTGSGTSTDYKGFFVRTSNITTNQPYPQTFTQLAYNEYSFSDNNDSLTPNQLNGTTYRYGQGFTNNPALLIPGKYVGGDCVSALWENYGGDVWDANLISQGTTPWATLSVPNGAALGYKSWDITALVKAWIGNAPRNAGLLMRATVGGDTLFWNTQYAGSNPPQLDITTSGGTVTLNAARSVELVSSSDVSQGGGPSMRTRVGSSWGLVWFDLSAYTNPNDILSATYRAYMAQQFQSQTVGIFALRNRNDPAVNTPPIETGLAAGYTEDIGIENHPAVVFYEDFRDSNFVNRFFISTGVLGGGQCRLVTTDEPANGFTRLFGKYNALNVYWISGGFASAVDAYWMTYDPDPANPNSRLLRLPGKSYTTPPNTLYFRAYVFLPAIGTPWQPSPQGGKFIGFDGRFGKGFPAPYNGIFSMGRGNSGSCADGITGYSCRGGFARYPATGSPIQNLYPIGVGGDVYDIYLSGTTGQDYGGGLYCANIDYLSMLRRGQWYCFEQLLQLNSVTNPTQKPRQVASLTQTGGVATCILASPESDPLYANGQTWTIGGVDRAAGGSAYNSPQTITVLNNTTFQFPILAGAAATAVPYANSNTPTGTGRIWAVPSQANADGVVAGWINGRRAGYSNVAKFRHTLWCTDQLTNFGIYALWFSFYHGGQSGPDQDFSLYISKIVAATGYIGPAYTPQ